jgi:hypothetical protein
MKPRWMISILGALTTLSAVALAGPGERQGPRGEGSHGEGHGPRGDGRGGVCREDRQRLCKDAGDKQATHGCMLSHKADLSAPCREKVERAEGFQTECKADVAKYCAEVPPGRGRIMACLIGRKADLAPACRKHADAAIAKFAEKRAKREARGKDGPTKKP